MPYCVVSLKHGTFETGRKACKLKPQKNSLKHYTQRQVDKIPYITNSEKHPNSHV